MGGQRSISANQQISFESHLIRRSSTLRISQERGDIVEVMAHSRRRVDLTFDYDKGKPEHCSIRGGASLPPGVEYRSVPPTSCDIQRCRAASAAEH